MWLINRQEYLEKLINVIEMADIKIISGVRCSGNQNF